ncbi:MAG TPA: DUF4139 domain-containing protein [Kofleriaceae bacterium]|nr:DUF4139 domain-containing protein [Kofleriaceae bacterium]
MTGQRAGWGWRLGALALVLGVGLRARAEDAGGGARITIYQPAGAAGQAAYVIGGAGYGGAYPVAVQPGSFALVSERRTFDLKSGKNTVAVRGVAARLDPSTVRFKSETDPAGTKVIEQTFAHDLASPDGLLERQVDRDIAVVTAAGEVRGKLLSFDAGYLVIDTGDRSFPIRLVKRGENVRDIRLAAPSGGLVAQPTLLWSVRAQKPGRHAAELSYRTAGMAWSADYTAVLGKGTVDLSGWVSVANQSGADFRGARVTLAQTAADPAVPAAYPGYRPQAPRTEVFALEQPMDLRSGSSVQLELFQPQSGARSEEILIYEPLANTAYYATGYPQTDCTTYQYQAVKTFSEKYVEVALQATRRLPDGRARLYRRSAGGALELVGEETVVAGDDRTLRLRTGTTEEVKGERRQLSCQMGASTRDLTEKIEIKVLNKGDRAVQVLVKEYMQRWTNWVVQEESVRGKQAGPVAREFRVKVPASGSKTITYTVHYSW